MKKIPFIFPMSKIMQLVLMLLAAFAASAAYLQAVHFQFVLDDATYTLDNTKLAELPASELWRLFTEPYNAFTEFLPLRDFSFWLDMKLFGLDPAVFHVHNILLYLLCLPLVYAATVQVWRYFRPADIAAIPWVAAVVTALFALHPSHAEAVVWIAGRKDVLCGLFSLLALSLALATKREGGISTPYAIATLVALFAAMLSKATAVAVAPVIAMLWVFFWLDLPERKNSRVLLLWPLAALFLAAGLAVIFASAVVTRLPIYWGVEAVTRSLAILGWLTRLSVSPESRHFFYPVMEDSNLPAMVGFGAVFFVVAVIAAVMLLRKRSLEGFALVSFLLICLPSLQLIPYAPPSLVSDRFVFLAVWPALLLLVSLMWRLKPLLRAILLLVIALSWGFQTMERPRDWHSFESLFEVDLRAYPGFYPTAVHKAIKQLNAGLNRDAAETANKISDPAVRNILLGLINADYFVRVNAVEGGDSRQMVEMLNRLGNVLKSMPDQAQWNASLHQFWNTCGTILLTQWDYLVKHVQNDAIVTYNAGLATLDLGKFKPKRYEAAINYLRAAIESQRLPEAMRGTAFYSMGLALIKSGRVAEAEVSLRTALEQTPPDLRANCELAQVYRQSGRIEEASRAEAACPGR